MKKEYTSRTQGKRQEAWCVEIWNWEVRLVQPSKWLVFAGQELCITNTIMLVRSNPILAKLNTFGRWEPVDANRVNHKINHIAIHFDLSLPQLISPNPPNQRYYRPSIVIWYCHTVVVCHISNWPQYTFSHTLTSLDSLQSHTNT